MSRIRSKNTKPETIVRKLLTQFGIRYRLHVKALPGKPDITVSRINIAVFINGCFWHQHTGCSRSTIPKSNQDYWLPKLKRNIDRQKKDIDQLEKEGWHSAIIWECETKNSTALMERLKKILK